MILLLLIKLTFLKIDEPVPFGEDKRKHPAILNLLPIIPRSFNNGTEIIVIGGEAEYQRQRGLLMYLGQKFLDIVHLSLIDLVRIPPVVHQHTARQVRDITSILDPVHIDYGDEVKGNVPLQAIKLYVLHEIVHHPRNNR